MDIVLFEPEIPQNTGNIGRLCVCSGSRLHIVGRPSFSLDESAVRRAGLDYWDRLELNLHADWNSFVKYADRKAVGQQARILLYTRFARRLYCDHEYKESDYLVFGRETSGLPDYVRESIALRQSEDHVLRIPVGAECRSLNLSNTVALVLYEGLRQQGFPGLVAAYEE